MSAIGGVFSRSGRPCEVGILEGLILDLAVIGPDEPSIRSRGPVGMVLCPFWTDEPTVHNRQPFAEDENHLLTWNGRLDNRLEVETTLGKGASLSTIALVLSTYRRWGVAGLRHLVGDFSISIWDRNSRSLTLATDPLGVRQLYYYIDDDFVFWASRARAVLAMAKLPPEPSAEYIAGFLLRHRRFDLSPYRKVGRLQAGEALIVDGAHSTRVRYWAPDPGRRIRFRSDSEYEESFRDLLHQAVGARLRAAGPVFADLSGGLDSSSIVCVGDRTLAADKGLASSLETVSSVYDCSELSDERKFISIVEAARGRQGLHISEVEAPLLERSSNLDFVPDQPNGQLVYLARHRLLAARMQGAGARVLLRGFGGDEASYRTFGPGPGPITLADDMARGKLLRAIWEAIRWNRMSSLSPWSALWWGGFWPLLPKGVAAGLGPHHNAQFFLRTREFFGPALTGIADLKRRVLGYGYDADLSSPSQRHQCSVLFEMAHFVPPDLILDEGCCEIRYPFYDRRLLEFVLAIPAEQQIRPGESRSLMRRALAGVLPPEIQQRRSKGGPEQAFFRALRTNWSWIGRWARQTRAVAEGWVDGDALDESIKQARHGIGTGPLLRIFALEFWLETLDRPMPSQGRAYNNVAPVAALQRRRQ